MGRLTEREFQSQVVELAKIWGWLVFHSYDSRRCAPGFPDLLLVHPRWGVLLAAELKTDSGRLTAEQQEWLEALRGAGVAAACWRPKDFDLIELALSGGTP